MKKEMKATTAVASVKDVEGKMKIYNTLTKKKEELKPIEEGKVKIYVCRTYGIQFFSYRKCKTLCSV